MNKMRYALQSVGAPHSQSITDKMYEFMDMVLEKNEYINLTAITDRDEFEVKHLMDSIICYGWPEIEKANKIVDVGTGAGFPGIPLALLYPSKEFLLVDSLNKRLEFIKEATAALGITNVKVLHGRAEDIGQNSEYREKYNLCISRALAKLPVLLEYCLPLIKPDGFLYAYKTKGTIDEIEESNLARKLLGASEEVDIRNREIKGFNLDHNILVIKKNKKTPKSYPRKAGTPSKVPL